MAGERASNGSVEGLAMTPSTNNLIAWELAAQLVHRNVKCFDIRTQTSSLLPWLSFPLVSAGL